MRSSVRILPHYTYEDWILWEGKWELIDGIAWAMHPLPGPDHQRIASNLTAAFGVLIESYKVYGGYLPIDYLVTDDIILQPDLLIVDGEITKEVLDFAPVLVAEVLTPKTELKDRYTKYCIYEKQGIRYYIVIAPDKVEAEVYELLGGEYHLKQSGKDIVHEFFFPECTARVDFKEIW
ncbi:Uma2 family endonuclease [Niastella sp. OAS944]|uniref:Uma2 family endonuclease n=1 Tax=Niastella sp. OAS944 TaxID=2664089 RepID=UPI00347BED98|nr:Uma2 family endonuclease [Chitinophagaceae bacterium OAS944]